MDEMRTLAGFREDVPAMERDAVRDARRRLHEEFAGPGRARGVWVRRGAAVAGLTAVLVAGVGVAQNVGGDAARPGRVGVLPGGPVANAEVARVARQARTLAEATPDVRIDPGTWTYVKDVIVETDGGAATARTRRTTVETWYTADGKRRASVGADGKVREHRPREDGPVVDVLSPQALPKPWFLIGAPADPAGMRDRVLAEVDRMVAMERRGEVRSTVGIGLKNKRDLVAFELIAQVLRQYYVSPRQQAGLYGALAYLDGVEVVPSSVDGIGRRGRAFGVVDAQGVRQEIIFDPRTYLYLGGRHVFVRDWTERPPARGVEGDFDPAEPLRMRKGAVVGWNAKADSGVVPGPGARP